MPKPLVSILMPVYNAEKFVTAALTSLLAEQTIPLEVIVVDDGSTDLSIEQINRLGDNRVQILYSKHHGTATALNMALSTAHGEIIMRCDADDLYPSGRISDQVEWLSSHPEFGAVCGNFATVDPKGRLVLTMSCGDEPLEITHELHSGITRTHLGTYAINADVLKTIGGFRPYFRSGEDIDLQLRIAETCRVWYQPVVRYYYRLHQTSLTHTMNSSEREFFDTIARTFCHQRRDRGSDDLQQGCPPTAPRSQLVLNANDHIQGLLFGRSWQEHASGRKLKAVITGLHALWLRPQNLAAWRNIIALILKRTNARAKPPKL